jgi:hypothetical protein
MSGRDGGLRRPALAAVSGRRSCVCVGMWPPAWTRTMASAHMTGRRRGRLVVLGTAMSYPYLSIAWRQVQIRAGLRRCGHHVHCLGPTPREAARRRTGVTGVAIAGGGVGLDRKPR